MAKNQVCNNYNRLKYSELSIVSFIIFLSVLLPLTILLLPSKLEIPVLGLLELSFEQSRIVIRFLAFWIFVAPILAFILSWMDLKKQNRLKTLSKITIIINGVIIGVAIIYFIITMVSDIIRILSIS
ncbi:hypothetical protein RBH29_04755 [Herbivorax sp. ANBcel31]|uniref:hypothetical protein n=1 Tax=Herbivorax sp. ANBcel31 TaxID=3069754 RepID=UPI0027B21902|nr:hypothetical protein [Herbivorax sp. ANBcel31]MDQ2085744.1 hypothetical protein [Herbivorax sp. ANBcel31]